jgi:hypothetical protein
MEEAVVNVYGEDGVKVQCCVRDLMCRPGGGLVRFLAVVHPTRGSILLTLCALDIISIYGLRFKIEHMFRQAVRLIGSFFYHFWMMDMKPLRHRNGNQYLHRESDHYRDSSPQNPCLPCLYAGWHHRPRSTTVSLGRVSQAGLRSAPGSEPFVQAFHHRNWSSVT